MLGRSCIALILTTLLTAVGGIAPASAAYETRPTPSWVPDNGRVFAMVSDGDRIYLGGTFTRMRNPATGEVVARRRLAALHADSGELVTGWRPRATGTVRALALDTVGTLYAGGDFTEISGKPVQRVVAIASTGRPVSTWTASADKTVRDIVVQPDGIFISGAFTYVNGTPRVGAAKLSPVDGSLLGGWNAEVSLGEVWAMAPSHDGSTMLLGGSFRALSGTTRDFLGSVSLDTGEVTDWAPPRPCSGCVIFDLTTADTSVYAAVGGYGGRVVSWDGTTGVQRWSLWGDGDAQAIAVYAGVVYAGGHFGPSFAGHERHQFAALNAADGALLDLEIPLVGPDQPGIWAILADARALHIAGAFEGVQGSSATRYARFPTLTADTGSP